MHGPPAVSHHIGRSQWYFGMLATLWSVALCVSVLLLQTPLAPEALWSILLALGLSCALSFAGWIRSDTGTLQWDGQHWLWPGFGEAPVQRMRLVLDFQKCILLQLRSEDGHVAWLWAQAGTSHHQWLAVRRAVVAAQRTRREPEQRQQQLDGEKV